MPVNLASCKCNSGHDLLMEFFGTTLRFCTLTAPNYTFSKVATTTDVPAKCEGGGVQATDFVTAALCAQQSRAGLLSLPHIPSPVRSLHPSTDGFVAVPHEPLPPPRPQLERADNDDDSALNPDSPCWRNFLRVQSLPNTHSSHEMRIRLRMKMRRRTTRGRVRKLQIRCSTRSSGTGWQWRRWRLKTNHKVCSGFQLHCQIMLNGGGFRSYIVLILVGV